MQKSKETLAKAKVQVVAISYDKQDVLSSFAKRTKIEFPLLSDDGSKTIEAFGIRNEDLKGSRIDGVPHPGTFLIGKDGTVTAKLFHDGYKKRHVAADIVDAVKKATKRLEK